MLKKASSTLWSITVLAVVSLITAFVPVLNPVIVSVNNCNPAIMFPRLLTDMDNIYPVLNKIKDNAYIAWWVPFATVVFLVIYAAIILQLILKLCNKDKGSALTGKILAWSSIAAGLMMMVLFGMFTVRSGQSVQFPIGAVVFLVVGIINVLLFGKYKKQLDAEDTRARYLKTIFTKSQKREAIVFYCMVGPFFLIALVATIYPIIWGLLYSFTNFTGYNEPTGVGFSNYMRCIQDDQTWTSFLTTLEIGIFYVPVQLVLGIALAMLLNTNLKGSGFFRTIYYFPSIVPSIATGMMWRLVFAQNGGILNLILSWFGVSPYNWLGYTGCRNALYIMLAWSAGGGILTYLSALKGINNELYESAMIDGAGTQRRFWQITIPMISSTLFYNLVTGLIAAWQIYGQPIFLAGATLIAVPYAPNYTFVVQLYQQILTNQRFGFGLAMVWILFAASLISNRIVFWTGNFWVFNAVEPDKKKNKKQKKQKAVVAGN